MDDLEVADFAKIITAMIMGSVYLVHRWLEKKRSGNVYKLGLMFILGAYFFLLFGLWISYNSLSDITSVDLSFIIILTTSLAFSVFGLYCVLVVHRHKLILNEESFIVHSVKNEIVELRYDSIRLVDPPKVMPFITFRDEEGQKCSVINKMPGIEILIKRIKKDSGGKVKGLDRFQLSA